jgi:serine/threonine-protein kinase
VDTLTEPLRKQAGFFFQKTPEDVYYSDNDKLLGEGGMGKVYDATNVKKTKSGKEVYRKRVALKVIKPDSEFAAGDPEKTKEMIENFLREVRAAATLEHDNIVRILDFGETDDGLPFFAMEYLRGMDLDEIVTRTKGGRLSWEQLKPLVVQICSALQAAHEHVDEVSGELRPIIHRDIKPMNVMVVKDSEGKERVKVLDFGLAKISKPTRKGVTQKGEPAAGTPEYMSPEQAQGTQDVDHRSDIYSVGALMYDLLSGRPPLVLRLDKEYHDFDDSEGWNAYVKEELNKFRGVLCDTKHRPSPLSEKGVVIPKEAEDIVMKCLEKLPSKRFQSVLELKEAILKCDDAIELDMDSITFLDDINDDINGIAYSDTHPSWPSDPSDSGRRATPEEAATTVYSSSRPSSHPPTKRSAPRWLFWGVVAGTVAVSGAAVGVGTHLARRDDSPAEPTERQPAKNMKPVSLTAPDSGASIDAEPLPEHILGDADITFDAEEAREHGITFITHVPGVTILLGDEELCRTSAEGSCTVTLPHGAEPVELVLRRPGYLEESTEVVPDEDQDIEVRLTRVPPRTKTTRPPVVNGHEPRIISPD